MISHLNFIKDENAVLDASPLIRETEWNKTIPERMQAAAAAAVNGKDF